MKFFSSKLRQQSNQLLLSIFSDLALFLKQNIWKSRNLIFKRWKLERNITKKLIRSRKPRSTHRKRKRSPTDTLNDYSSPSTSTSRTYNAITPYSHIDHCHQRYSQLYSITNLSDYTESKNLLDAEVAFIRATSSNFLHSGPWYNHLINRNSYVPFSLDSILFFGWDFSGA
ncbi:hypothetical protein RclHR1_19570002 [Rhizophagus clarus]|uniref:Uncharacterized protein n=1 Tax=Rhizophagus clarus TaxID=94130 RepID=A0A2Z6R1Y7_9GLOM|nr:hypothetical protein RclHR1_19570002 [Rhizophagus clarus]